MKKDGNGFYIESGQKRLISQQIRVKEGATSWVKWFSKLDFHDLDTSSNWEITPVSVDIDDPQFIISHPYIR